jgi:predicted phage terminase large subunit-like protein
LKSKSYGLLLEAIRHIDNPGYGAVIFRRTYPEITNEGGLWDESSHIYPFAGGRPIQSPPEWIFKSGAKVRFAHMQYDRDRYSWQGSQIALIGFDELTHFSRSQFFYMLSRNRSTCGIKPYMRATCNPDADSWVKTFLGPWVHEDWPIEDRAESGEPRFFLRDGDEIVWMKRGETHPDALSCTFIEASLDDNPALEEKDPDYRKRLLALPLVERERLLHKNWQIREEGGNKFRRAWFPMLDAIPDDIDKVVRFWDFAATEATGAQTERDGPDYTASCKIARRKAGSFPRYVILHATWDRKSPGKVEEMVRTLAEQDGRACEVYFEQEPGSSGKSNTFNYKTRVLNGYYAQGIPSTGPKEVRANTFSSQAEAGNVGILRAHWNEGFFGFLEPFPSRRVHDDVVDAGSGAMVQIYLKYTGADMKNELTGRQEAHDRIMAERKQQISDTYW